MQAVLVCIATAQDHINMVGGATDRLYGFVSLTMWGRQTE